MQKESDLKVTLDACIIFRLALCDTLLTFAEIKLFKPTWSSEILDEVFKTSRKNLSQEKNLGLEKRVNQMNESFTEANYEAPVDLVAQLKPKLPDTDDAHVVATAIASNSKFIITQNLRDYPEHALSPFGIEALSFDSFMSLLFESNPEEVIKGLSKLIESKSNPTISLREHLLQLESYSPSFNRMVREYLLNIT